MGDYTTPETRRLGLIVPPGFQCLSEQTLALYIIREVLVGCCSMAVTQTLNMNK